MTANEQLRDLILSHQIGVNRLANREVRRALSILGRIESELLRILRSSTGLPDALRLSNLLSELDRIIPGVYSELHGYLRERLVEIGATEAGITVATIKRAVPGQIIVALGSDIASVPSSEFLTHLARSRPFQGRLLHNWARRLQANTRRSLAKVIRDGIREGQSVQKVARAIRGSKASGFTDGVLENVTRQQAEAMVRTATQHVVQGARQKTFQSSRLVSGYQWLSTLDLRTTLAYCVPRDHKPYDRNFRPIGHDLSWGAGPGRLHWNCRSSMTASLKSWRELGVNAKELSPSARASMDGQVAAGTDAETFLKRQLSDKRRRAQLEQTWGSERLDLFESGRLSVDDMVKRDGGLIRLRDLRRIHGLD